MHKTCDGIAPRRFSITCPSATRADSEPHFRPAFSCDRGYRQSSPQPGNAAYFPARFRERFRLSIDLRTCKLLVR